MRPAIKPVLLSLAFLSALWGIWFVTDQQPNEKLIKEMLQGSSFCPALVEWTADEYKLDLDQQRAFWKLWQAREQRDIGPELVPLLTSPSAETRHNALRACMLLEFPACEATLQKLSAQPPNNTRLPFTTQLEYQLALGRVQARHKSGKARLNTFLAPTGLRWVDAVAISQKVNSLQGGLYFGSKGQLMMRYLVEMIHDMQRQGDNVEPLRKQLRLKPAQSVALHGSLLSVEEEADLIINHALKIPAYTKDNTELMEMIFPRLGPKATDILLTKLQDIAERPHKYPDTSNGTHRYALMNAAVATQDSRFIPIFKELGNGANDRAGYKLQRELNELQRSIKTGCFPSL